MSKYYHPINRLTAYFNFFSSGMLISIQDISENSDIDWSKSIKDIDQQLYSKYELTDEEIKHIENSIKEM